ncbi:MAG: CofH family radical SAM protein [Planctomycetota bacterium]
MADTRLEAIRSKVLNGTRLDLEDGLALYRTRDLFTLGELANSVRERLHGRRAYYNINRHINYTNFCVLRCKFCSFYRTHEGPRGPGVEGPSGLPGALPLAQPAGGPNAADLRLARDGGYEYSVAQVVELAAEACARGATEVHIVGGLHPKLPFSYYTDLCRGIKARCPELHIKAFTAIEIVHFTRVARPRMSIAEVLTALRAAGLDSLPGGGAEIFDDRVHAEAFRNKVGEQHWFDVHRVAHELGIPSNATMLYGHVESVEERLGHMLKLRAHQDVSLRERKAAFQCFVPLSFIPEGSAFAHLPGPSGLDDLRTLAVARLMLDNFPHIKAFWVMHSPKLAQVALNWGVDDFDGTVVWYDITRREGRGTNRQELTVAEIHRLAREAGCVPTERDTLYRPVQRSAPAAASPDRDPTQT